MNGLSEGAYSVKPDQAPIRVLLADDHALVRAGFRALLQNLEGIHVVAEAHDGTEVLQLIQAHQPDIVLVDIAMPGLNGLEATAQIVRNFPAVRVIILSMYANAEYVRRALGAGALGYLVKDASAKEFELAIRAVAQGETYLATAAAKYQPIRKQRQSDAAKSHELLTPRQREILTLIAQGYTTLGIAQLLNISVKTAETHRSELMERLDLHDVASLVRFAIREGLGPPDE